MYISRIDVAQPKNQIKFKSKEQVPKKTLGVVIDFLEIPKSIEKDTKFQKFMDENFPVRFKDDSSDPFVEDKWSC